MKYRSFQSFLAIKLVTVSCLIGSSTVSAERYAGSVDIGDIIFGVQTPDGQGNFAFSDKPHYEFEIEVDRSQNVTFNKFDMTYVGHFEFTGHPGQVYLDIELSSSTDPGTIDMNPFPYGDHTFRSQPFEMGDLRIKGDYFNRGFESSFDEIFINRSLGGQMSLSFTDFPNSLQLGGGELMQQHFSASAALVELEPFLTIQAASVRMITTEFLDLRLDPLPPVEIVQVVGDSNLDGKFNSGDLVTVFQAGQYEDSIVGNSTWETGDWNKDLEFDSGDLVVAFQAGEYESNEVVAVPEPTSLVMGLGALLWAVFRLRLNSNV